MKVKIKGGINPHQINLVLLCNDMFKQAKMDLKGLGRGNKEKNYWWALNRQKEVLRK